MQLRVRHDHSNGSVIVNCTGEVDLSNAGELRGQLLTALHRRSCRLVFDLSEIDFMDSTALGMIVATARRAALLGGWLRLAAPPSTVWKLLSSTQVHHAVPVYRSVEAAVRDPEAAGCGPRELRWSNEVPRPDWAMSRGL